MKFIDQLKANEGNLLAAGIAWTIGLAWFTLGGFYLGTIFGKKHVYDLQAKDISGIGLNGMIIGLLVGIAVASFITFAYPKSTKRDEEAEAAAEHAHH